MACPDGWRMVRPNPNLRNHQMKRLLLCASAIAAITATYASAQPAIQAPRFGQWGFDTTAMDPAVKPGAALASSPTVIGL